MNNHDRFDLGLVLVPVIFLFFSAGATFGAVPSETRTPVKETGQAKGNRTVPVYLFWGEGCAHCEEERQFLAGLRRADPRLQIREYEVLKDTRNLELMTNLMEQQGKQPVGVPVTFIGDRLFVGFSDHIRDFMMKALTECLSAPCSDPVELLQWNRGGRDTLVSRKIVAGFAKSVQDRNFSFRIPIIGALDASSLSLPVLTFIIAGMDSFNPCAFFVLLSLLGLLVHAQSRNRMLLVGGVFVFFSAFISLLVMAAWLNLFLVMANVSSVTTVAGLVSLALGTINVKDFFVFKKGITLSIPASAKPRLFDHMRKLVRSASFLSILAGTTVLAILANFYELLCTAGFPMVFTRVLTLDRVPAPASYFYILLYSVIRVLPLLAIVLAFTITLGKKKLTEQQGRTLKLVSGLMMIGLSAMLLLNPNLLNSLAVSLTLMTASIGISMVLAAVARWQGYY
jgi:glutaredoxin